jgi:hypothetical protein
MEENKFTGAPFSGTIQNLLWPAGVHGFLSLHIWGADRRAFFSSKKIAGVGIGMCSTHIHTGTHTTERMREKKYQGPFFTEQSSHLLPWKPTHSFPEKPPRRGDGIVKGLADSFLYFFPEKGLFIARADHEVLCSSLHGFIGALEGHHPSIPIREMVHLFQRLSRRKTS